MYEEYIQKWRSYSTSYGSQTCLFYMVGKFYELYDILDKQTGEGQTNVKQAVESLGITLTVREGDGPKGENCLFAGFPEQSLQKFAGMLTRDGWTVVVCDQEKSSAGKVVDRPVARIFSPGTHIELAGAEAPYLAGLWLQEIEGSAPSYAAAVLDLTTGHLVSFESKAHGTPEVWSSDELVHFFQIHPPRETVVWWRGAPIAQPTEAQIQRRCGLGTTAMHMELANPDQQGTLEHPLVRKSFLEKVFSTRLCLLPVVEQLHLRSKELSERVLVCLLRFAEEHLPSAIANLYDHVAWIPEHSMYLGNNTLEQLNYVGTGSEQSVLSLFPKTLTSLGKRALRERLLTPLSNASEIEERLADVEWILSLPEETIKQFDGYLRLIHDLARLHRKVMMYSVSAADVLALDTSYGSALRLCGLLLNSRMEMPEEVRKEFATYKQVFEANFDIEKAKMALKEDDISFLPTDKAPKTASIEDSLKSTKQKVKDVLETIRQWVGLPPDAIRIDSQETSSYVFTATKATLAIVKRKLNGSLPSIHPYPAITVHEKKSGRGSIEFPLLDTFHAQTFSLRGKLRQAIQEEVIPICKAVQSAVWGSLERWIAHVDVTLCLAKVARERGYVRPTIVGDGEEAGLSAQGLRHPLLESIQTRVEYVRHDVSLGWDTESGWLLYGMNASGKSSLMKSIGISVLLAQAGSFVPASSFKLKPFRSMLTRILNTDSLWAGLSSFAVEVSELRDIFQKADAKSLVLGDELCSGTESVSATSLVAAGIHYLHTKHSRFVFATHLHDLNKLPEIASLPGLGIWHLRVHYDPATDKLIYDRTLHRGPGGTLYGLEVARAMHLPHSILKQALVYRRKLLGETSLEEAEASSWNAQVFRKSCEVCSSSLTRDLEVHHIQPRASAVQGRLTNGSSMNDLRNLIVVCQACHDKHHAGELVLGPQIQTSAGPQRIVETKPPSQKIKVRWTNDELATIHELLRKSPHLPLARLVYELKHNEDIEISLGSLRKMRDELTEQ